MLKWRVVEEARRYSVSKCGRVWDNKRDVEVSKVIAGLEGNQYYYVNLQTDEHGRKLRKLSRLVAKAFIPNTRGVPVVDHIDRDKLNDNVDNLRWVTYLENSRNKDYNVYIKHNGEDILLRDFLISKDVYSGSYNWFREKLEEMTLEEAIELFEDEYRNNSEVVEWEGVEIKLKKLCDKLNKNFREVGNRYRGGWDVWSSIYNIPPISRYTVAIKGDGVHYCYSSLEHLMTDTGRSIDLCKKAIVEGWTLDELTEYAYDARKLYEIDGVSKTRDDWVAHYETSIARVETNMTNKGLSFTEAVKLPVVRVKMVEVNGVKMKVREMYERYGLNAKLANTVKSHKGLTFKQTLEHYKIDTTGITITPS